MSQENKLGLRGPVALALGGTFVVFPLLTYSLLLYDGRLSFPYSGAASGMMLFVCTVVFLGLMMVGMGLQMILRDSR
ncbi:MAG: hypothetical protein ACFFBJ_07990 [Promethearchaeota archaeon]|jgi:hypothetical protein